MNDVRMTKTKKNSEKTLEDSLAFAQQTARSREQRLRRVVDKSALASVQLSGTRRETRRDRIQREWIT